MIYNIFSGSPEIRIKKPFDFDAQTDFWNIYVGWDSLGAGGTLLDTILGITDDITYFQLNIDEYGNRASDLDFNLGGIKGNFKLNPINGRPSKCFNFSYKSYLYLGLFNISPLYLSIFFVCFIFF